MVTPRIACLAHRLCSTHQFSGRSTDTQLRKVRRRNNCLIQSSYCKRTEKRVVGMGISPLTSATLTVRIKAMPCCCQKVK